MPDIELVVPRNRELKFLPVAHHVEGLVADNRVEADHTQHVGPADQNVSANFFEVGDLPALLATIRCGDVDRRVERLYLRRIVVETIDQLLLGGSPQLGSAGAHLYRTGTEQAPGGNKQHWDCCCTKCAASLHNERGRGISKPLKYSSGQQNLSGLSRRLMRDRLATP